MSSTIGIIYALPKKEKEKAEKEGEEGEG